MASLENQILDSLRTILLTLPWPNYVEFETIRMLASDFSDHELPAVQFFDAGRSYSPSSVQSLVLWNIQIECVMKRTIADDLVDQGLLLDRMDSIEKKIGEDPQIALGSTLAADGRMVHVTPVSAITDIHLLSPLFLGQMVFQARYYKPFTGEC